MNGNVPSRFINQVVERPDNLSAISYRNSAKYDDLAASLIAIGPSKSIRLSIQETVCLFGRSWAQNIRAQMKKRQVQHVRMAKKEDTVHFWKNHD